MKICFVDTLGLCYDGSTLSKRGLGGSESALIFMSKELHKLGFDVTVFNDCISDDASPGTYDGVLYRSLHDIEQYKGQFDIYIASRSVVSFAPNEMKSRFKWSESLPNLESVAMSAKHRVLWMHDTFCDGDDLIEDFILQGRIHEIFTLTDWHTTYVTNCDHGKRRNFDILKKHIFQTRNGIQLYHDFVDVSKKDPNLFVYNASVTKGMIPLVEKVWPQVKQNLPDAKLKVIGGFYRFRSSHGPDQQEMDWRRMVDDPIHRQRDIEFTGIISQKEIADILRDASFMLYPAAFPETFGISTLESLAYNTPLITCRFGALEETAIDMACYKIPYPVEKNWSLPWLSEDQQVQNFVRETIHAYNNKYLTQQKMYACNQVKDICTWDTVALQWKQHFYKLMGDFLPIDEYRNVTYINHKVHRIFGRRTMNYEEAVIRKEKENKFCIITPVYNAENYIDKCIKSVASQDYENYQMYIIDDCSTDKTVDVVIDTIKELGIKNKFTLLRNGNNKGAVYNQINSIKQFCEPDSIVMLLDGDDWLANNPNIFNMYNNTYNRGAEYTYGSCWSLVDNIPLIAQPYPPEVKANKSYRQHKFNWNFPYPHLRTFKASLALDLDESLFKDENGEWYRAGGDVATFYNIIEQADPSKVVCVPEIVYMYNDTNPINDYKVNGTEQNDNAAKILGEKVEKVDDKVLNDLRKLGQMDLLPPEHKNYLREMSNTSKPKIIYDIGACVMHWTNAAKNAWPDSEIIAFEAMDECATLYKEKGMRYNCGLLGAEDGKEIDFYQNLEFPGGNSYYRENINVNKEAHVYFPDQCAIKKRISRLDTVVKNKNFPAPDMIKMDVQGAELDILKGCGDLLKTCNDLILELPNDNVEYNVGAPKKNEVIEWLEKEGFQLVKHFSPSPYDADYHFTRKVNAIETTHDNRTERKKRILIGVPTARYVETETMKSIYDMIVPEGYETELQFFYGYQIDQIRNLIADWMVNGPYDYLLSIDSDIIFPKDTLIKMINHDKDLISGMYRQRLPDKVIELYDLNQVNIPYDNVPRDQLIEIGGCGFGCVLIKKHVFQTIGYPQFEYRSALKMADTFSEDVDFCKKAKERGFKMFADTSIKCGHKGTHIFEVD